jgi:hypothetical protein
LAVARPGHLAVDDYEIIRHRHPIRPPLQQDLSIGVGHGVSSLRVLFRLILSGHYQVARLSARKTIVAKIRAYRSTRLRQF